MNITKEQLDALRKALNVPESVRGMLSEAVRWTLIGRDSQTTKELLKWNDEINTAIHICDELVKTTKKLSRKI